ncbi:MAG: hypothetical protein AAF802_32640 [Planctomycetota bacterium]
MKSNESRLLVLVAISTVPVLSLFGWLYWRIERPASITQLETSVASLPLGISAEEADAHIGSIPDSVTQAFGVLATPVTMLAAENELSAEYGQPEEFTLRRYSRDGVHAVVAIDADGNVAGRWTHSPYKTEEESG